MEKLESDVDFGLRLRARVSQSRCSLVKIIISSPPTLSALISLGLFTSFGLQFGLYSTLAMEWDPSRFFRPEGSPSPYALLILNQPINENAFGVLSRYGKILYELCIDAVSWIKDANANAASYIICADGGANRLFDMPEVNGKGSKAVSDIYRH